MTELHPENAVFYLERDMEEVEVRSFCGGRVAISSIRSPVRDGPNQDAAALVPFDTDSGVLLVADGAGGVRGGAQASSTTAYELVAALEQGVREGKRLREAILDGIEGANREVQALGIGAATTLALVELRADRVRPYHVGDSQALLLGQRGRLKLLTSSHSPVGYAERSGMLDEEEAMGHEDRHYVSNVIGLPEMTIEIGSEVELAPRDTLVVACDGLFDNLTRDEIIEILKSGDLEAVARELVGACRERMLSQDVRRPSKPDDLTVLVYRPGSDVEDD